MVNNRIWNGTSAEPEVVSLTDYYPFGAERNSLVIGKGYRWNFQGQELDQETGLINYKYRMHDPRVGRFFAVDPLEKEYPWNSPYAFSENRVIDGVELEGLEYLDVDNANIPTSGVTVNSDGTSNLDFGNSVTYNNVSTVDINGANYYDIGAHLYYGSGIWSTTGTSPLVGSDLVASLRGLVPRQATHKN